MAKSIGRGANVNDTFEKISDGAGVHGVKQFEVLKNWENDWNNMLTKWDDTRTDRGKSEVKEASMWNTGYTATGHLAPWSGMSCERCVIYPQHPQWRGDSKSKVALKTNRSM